MGANNDAFISWKSVSTKSANDRSYTKGKRKNTQAKGGGPDGGVPDSKGIYFMPRLKRELHSEARRNGHNANDCRG